jgi:predicted MPP superfamily phosphohydrolase
MRQIAKQRSRGRLARAITRPPFRDDLGHKGWFHRISRPQPHIVRHHHLKMPGWPQWRRAMRLVFLSDFHTGSHSDDVARLSAIVAEASSYDPDLVLFGGDYVNMQLFGGGRVPPGMTASILSRLEAPLGRYAVLGNHDYDYGQRAVAGALERHNITVLNYDRMTTHFQNHSIDIVGLPDARVARSEGYLVLAGIMPDRPTIILTHDPVWFEHVPPGPHLTLAGHTHGGQIRFPGIGIMTNVSKAPLRWSHGLIHEDGKYLYVTSGLGTSCLPLRIGVLPEYAVLDVTGDLDSD